MKLIVNTSTFEPPLTGIGHYTTSLMKALMAANVCEDIKGVYWNRPGHFFDQEEINHFLETGMLDNKSQQNQSVEKDWRPSQPDAPSAKPLPGRRLRHALWSRTVRLVRRVPYTRSLKRALSARLNRKTAREYPEHLYWEPNYLRLGLDNPAVVTVYDLSYLAHPEFHTEETVTALSTRVGPSIRDAERIVTISKFTRDEIVKEYDIDPARIDIVPPAVDDSFREPAAASRVAELRTRYNLPDQYLLSVGTLEPRKNVEGLLRCYAALPAALRQQYPLVLVGGKGWLTGDMEALMAPLLDSGEVRRLGYVDQKFMPALYQQASLMAYISYYEGYGMPVAEAMAAGTAVLTSNRASMPEVAQGAAELINPADDTQITAALNRLLSDEALRQTMVRKGLEISSQYCWQHSCELFIQALQRAQRQLDKRR